MMSSYRKDGALEYIGDQFEFGACPNPNCKKFNKPFKSRRSASGHFGCKKECSRIHIMMMSAYVTGETKPVLLSSKKRIKVDMPDVTKLGRAPPIFPPKKTVAAYRPLYIQTNSRVPDLSGPFALVAATETKNKSAINPDESVDDNQSLSVSMPIVDNSVSSDEEVVDQDAKVQAVAAAPTQHPSQNHKSPFLSDSGKAFNSRSHVQDRNSKTLQPFPLELVLVAELITMLDSMGATKKAVEKVLKWNAKAALRNANFLNLPVTRDANMALIRSSLPKRMVDSYLPYVKPIRMCGYNEDVNVVGFDIVTQILSLLHSPSHMREENLVLNPDNHFDNYYYATTGVKNANRKIDCARMGSVYQDYIRRKAVDFNEFVFDLIIGFDSVNVTKNGRTTSCPVLISSSLFKEECRRKPEFWKVIGYIVNPTEKSKSENITNNRGHSTRNIHHQLEVILSDLKRLHSREDRRLDSVQVTIGKETRQNLRIDTPVLFFILDGKERESVTVKVKGTHRSTNRHSCPCDVAPYTNLSLASYGCSIMKSEIVEYYVDHNDEHALHELSQYNIRSAFRGVKFCDNVHGVYGAITTDSLHCVLLCFFKRMLGCFYGKLSDTEKEVLDRMARRYDKGQRSCCSDDYPRTSFINGITNLKQKEGKEYRGMIFVLCILIHDMTAWDLLSNACRKKNRDLTEILNTFEMMLCFDAWTKGGEYWKPNESPLEERRARDAIGVVIDKVKTHLPREQGNQWDLPNLHALFHYPRDISRYGPPNEYTTWFMEAGHKHHVKMPGRSVAKVKGRFDHGLALSVKNQYELKMFLECAKAQCDVISDEESDREAIDDDRQGGVDGVSGVSLGEEDDETQLSGSDGGGSDVSEDEENDSVSSVDDVVSVSSVPTNDDAERSDDTVPVLVYVRSSRLLSSMLRYSTRYVIKTKVNDDGTISVNVTWLTRSYHEHTLKDGIAAFLVRLYGIPPPGVERRIYCFTKCRFGKWLVHCHPNERGKGPWYDWVMVKTTLNNVVRLVPARVASFFIREDDPERKLRVVVQFAGSKIPETSSVLFDIYEFSADDPGNHAPQSETYACIDHQRIVKAVYAKTSSDLTKVVVARDREQWGAQF